ncbi:MAG TPA: hypothetical protein VES66_08405, partial [Terriglobales bacterium]|nr:hypothetical protein [Terriglobales bacterium]
MKCILAAVLAVLGMLVVSERPGDKKIVEGWAPKIAEARLVHLGYPPSADLVNGAGLFNQIAVAQPPPVDRTLFAVLNVLPLVSKEIVLKREKMLGVLPSPVFGDYSCMQQHPILVLVLGNIRQVIGRLPAIQVLLKGHNLGGRSTVIYEADGKRSTSGIWKGRTSASIPEWLNIDEHPRTFGIDDSP